MVRWPVLSMLLVGCGARTALGVPDEARPDASVPTSDVGVDARDSDAVEPPPICAARDAGGGSCALTLVVTSVVKSSSTCFIDTEVRTGALGSATCGGGAARVEFGGAEFLGGFDGDAIDVCSSTEFDWDDGCHWRTSQRVFGSVKTGRLSFRYDEAPAPGESGCLPPCSATGTIEVRP